MKVSVPVTLLKSLLHMVYLSHNYDKIHRKKENLTFVLGAKSWL